MHGNDRTYRALASNEYCIQTKMLCDQPNRFHCIILLYSYAVLSCFFIFGQPNRALKWVKMTAVSAIFYIISVHKYRMQMEKAYAGNVLLISEVETNGFI